MQAVILAAGQGARFKEMTHYVPKPLLPLHNSTLLEWVMGTLKIGGVDEFLIITGYMGVKIEKLIEQKFKDENVKYVYNPNWKLGNLTSLCTAMGHTDGVFLLSMADHLFDPTIVSDIVDFKSNATVLLGVDRKYQQTEDDTKVLVKDSMIREIGKEVFGNYVDIGLFKMKEHIFKYCEDAITERKYSLSNAISIAAHNNDAMVMDINRRFWIDVDTPAELNSYYVQNYPKFIKNGKWD